jgi:uncharacterized membrane protein YhdT
MELTYQEAQKEVRALPYCMQIAHWRLCWITLMTTQAQSGYRKWQEQAVETWPLLLLQMK